jgi:hypothetical protein
LLLWRGKFGVLVASCVVFTERSAKWIRIFKKDAVSGNMVRMRARTTTMAALAILLP